MNKNETRENIKKIKFMVGTMDNSQPAQRHNDSVADLLGWDFEDTDFSALTQEQIDAGLCAAFDIACSLHGDNADAFIA